MHKLKALGLSTICAAAVAGTTFGARTAGHAATAGARPHKGASVLLYIDGALGDLGFFDSANAGVQRAQRALGATVKVIQNNDNTQWQGQLLRLAGTHKYDLIIVTASDANMNNATKALIGRYPGQRVIDFDDNSFASKSNVSTIIYKQNEGSFLAGALAAMVAGDAKLPYVSHKNVIGMVGGQREQVILDFRDGYAQGAQAVSAGIKVKETYIGGSGGNDTWNNGPAGARLARSLYDQGAAVVYQVAGGSGLGVLSQAKASNRYAIGVDSNQDAQAPGHVIGSVVKHVDNSLYDLIRFYMKGDLQGGHIYYYGLKNNGVGLTRDAYTRAIITPAMYKRLDALAVQVASGKIKVKSEFK
jgi:basic membrane protein A